MEEERYEEGGGTTFREIIGSLIKHLWIVLGVTVLAALIVFLVVRLGINPKKFYYEYSFYVIFPDSESGKYPDGTPFDYRDIIADSNLQRVKEANEEFKEIDIEKMSKEGDIAISRTVEELRDLSAGNTNGSELAISYEYKYTVKVQGHYFGSGEEAAHFITELAQYPVSYANTVASGTGDKANLLAFKNESVLSYSELVGYLSAQKNYIVSKYNRLIAIYGEDYLINGHSLSHYLSELKIAYSEEKETQLQNEIALNAYTYRETEADVLVKIGMLEREIDVNKAINDELYSQMRALIEIAASGSVMSLDLEAYNNKIADLTAKIKSAEDLISVYYTSIYYTKTADGWEKMTGTALTEAQGAIAAKKDTFNKNLNEVYAGLDTATNTYQTVNTEIYKSESRLVSETTGISAKGGLSSVLFTGIALVGVFLVAWLVVFLYEKYKAMQAAEQTENAEKAPSEEPKDGTEENK